MDESRLDGGGTGSIGDIAGGRRRSVDVAGIERELTRLWKSAADTPESTGAEAVTRACVLNLVVYAASPEAADRASEMIAQVATHDPCRAIVVAAEPEAPEAPLAAWISAHCYLPGPGSPQVCCEQITISARGNSVALAHGLVLPLLASDLPVFVWWLGDPPLESPILARFFEAADRVILDSASFAAPCSTLARVGRLVSGDFQRVAFSDLNWARLTPWRDLTAQFFDAPDLRSYLQRIDSVAVDYSARPGDGYLNRAQAALLVAWLASRLGWRPEDAPPPSAPDCNRRLLRPSGERVDVAIRSAATRGDGAGGLVAVRLHAAGDSEATFSLSRAEESDCVTTRLELAGRPPVQRTSWLAPADDVQLLCQELEFLGRDRVFEEALGIVGAIVGE